jgi:hypothetical protein
MTFDDAIRFTADGQGTALRAEMTTRPEGLFRLVAPVMGSVIRKQFAANWVKLKEAIESGN